MSGKRINNYPFNIERMTSFGIDDEVPFFYILLIPSGFMLVTHFFQNVSTKAKADLKII